MSLIHRKYCFLRAPWVVMRVLIVFLLLWGNTDHLGGKGLLAYKEQSIIEGSQVRNLEVREKTSNKQECCSQTCSPLSAQLFFFFYTSYKLLPGMLFPTVGWSVPYQSIIKKIPQRHGQSQSEEGNSSIEIPSSQVHLHLWEVDKINYGTGQRPKAEGVLRDTFDIFFSFSPLCFLPWLPPINGRDAITEVYVRKELRN